MANRAGNIGADSVVGYLRHPLISMALSGIAHWIAQEDRKIGRDLGGWGVSGRRPFRKTIELKLTRRPTGRRESRSYVTILRFVDGQQTLDRFEFQQDAIINEPQIFRSSDLPVPSLLDRARVETVAGFVRAK